MINIEQYRQYCLSKKGTSEHFPFDEDVLVFKVDAKVFTLSSLRKWEKGEASINLKCDPEFAVQLRAEYGYIRPGFHMNKKHWNTVYLQEENIDIKLFYELIDHFYDCVCKKMTRKEKEAIHSIT